MRNPEGESDHGPLRPLFDRRLKLEFHGSRVTSDAGLLAYRELDDVLGLTALAGGVLADSRTGRNGWHGIVSLLRQSVYGRLAGYEDVNDADRLGRDPAMRWIVGGKAVERGGASTSQMGRFETELLANNENLAGLADLSGMWIDRVHDHDPPRRVVLDMDSSDSSTFGEQEGTAYNGHFGCTCYHPLFVFNQFGDLERCALRPDNVHCAHGWRDVLVPVVEHYKERAIRLYFQRRCGLRLTGDLRLPRSRRQPHQQFADPAVDGGAGDALTPGARRLVTGGDTPASRAASSLERPVAIAAQNRTSSSRRAESGRPGECNLLRPDRSDRRLRTVIATSYARVLRRPIELALASPIAMVDQTGARLAQPDSTVKRPERQVAGYASTRGPADDAPGVEVEHDGQVQPALCRPDIADVGSPFLVGCLGGEVLVEKVRCDGLVVLAVRRLF